MAGSQSGQWHFRALEADDIPLLRAELPALLGGNWPAAALAALLESREKAGASRCCVLAAAPASPPLAFAEYQVVLDECELLNLAVLPHCQRRGLGRALLQYVLDAAQALGCSRCLLELRRSNTAARGLYEAAGFVQVGVRKEYYPALGGKGPREDALLYTCELG